MADNTKIEWCDHTHNHWTGCAAISPACDLCYAAAWAKRAGRDFAERMLTTPANRRKPLKWNAGHEDFFARNGRRQRVFTNSLADVFDNQVPQEWRESLFELIRATPSLDWLLLSKRIGNAARMLPADWGAGYPNVWLGSTVVNQQEADRDVSKLLRVPAAVHFLSCEPLLGPIELSCIPWPADRNVVDDVSDGFDALRYASGPHIDWVIAGGESGGTKARPMNALWADSLRRQCAEAGVAFFFKQGSQANWPKYKDFASFPRELKVREWPLSVRA